MTCSESTDKCSYPLLAGLALELIDSLALLPGGVLTHLLLSGVADLLVSCGALLVRHVTALLLSESTVS